MSQVLKKQGIAMVFVEGLIKCGDKYIDVVVNRLKRVDFVSFTAELYSE